MNGCRPLARPRWRPNPRLTSMAHSVRGHLGIEIDLYDETIRRFIPGYEEGLGRAAREVAAVRPRLVLDLGAGTGALSGAILDEERVGAVLAIDIDADMLGQARVRLEPFGRRARFELRSFDDPLRACDAVAASLSLHHIRTMERKSALYRRIFRALRPGGIFVNADVTMSAHPAEGRACYRAWAAHLVSCGIDERRAYEHFEEWAAEDTYFPAGDEVLAMRAAGFRAECAWRDPPFTLLTGRKP